MDRLWELRFLLYGENKILTTKEQYHLFAESRRVSHPVLERLHRKEEVSDEEFNEALDIARRFRSSLS